MEGRKHSPEIAEKLRQYRIGIKHTDETKAKMSKAHKGRKITWTDKISLALRKFTQEQCEEIRHRIALGEKVKDIASDHSVSRTTISKIKMGKYP